jgi:ethanolamine ammonia-lyase small subunit
MGAYITYKPTMGMEEARRTVISNIHDQGTAPVEAGAQIAELCQTMIKHKMSGVDLKLI